MTVVYKVNQWKCTFFAWLEKPSGEVYFCVGILMMHKLMADGDVK